MASQLLEEYYSDSESDDREVEPVRKKQKNHNYKLVETFKVFEEAANFVKSARAWSQNTSRDVGIGRKVYYDCKTSRDCPLKLYILFQGDMKTANVYQTDVQHNHPPKIIGISNNCKVVIDELFALGVTKPKSILQVLRDRDIEEPKKTKLNVYLRKLRAKAGRPIVSLGQLQQLCEENSKIPEDIDTAFVSKSLIHIDDDDEELNCFRLFVTTKRLLSLMNQSKVIHVDGTYKLMWNGFPVIVAGTSDRNRSFHPYGIAVTYSEAAADYEFVFRSLDDGFKIVNPDCNFNPMSLIADCAQAITLGCDQVFKDITRVHCWAHVIRNVDIKLRMVRDEVLRQQIRLDIVTLQYAKSKEEFEKASQLWLQKWDVDEFKDFVKYFNEEYLVKSPGWYEGISPESPSTNNCIESTNANIKKEWTARNRLPVRDFLETAFKKIKEWSQERDPTRVNAKLFSIKPSVSLDLETKAYNWARSNLQVLARTYGVYSYYYVQPGDQLPIKDTDLKKYDRQATTLSWRYFDTYAKSQKRLWKITEMNENWELSTCTCFIYQKQFICKHILGIAIRQKKFIVRPEAKNIPIGEKRKRGRPALAKKALLLH